MSLSIQGQNGGFGRRFLSQTLRAQSRASQRLASGKRIVSAADDSAGLAIARRLEAEVRGAAQGERNLADGQSLVRTAEAALGTSQDTIGRMRELTIQAQNGTLSDADRATIQQEYDQLAAQLDQTAAGTDFGGRPLLDGSASGTGAIELTDGDGGSTQVAIDDARAQALGVSGLDVSDPNTLAALDNAQDTLSSQRARLGALDNNLDRQRERLAVQRENQEAARSRIEDADVAREIAEVTRNRILSDLAIAGQRIQNRDRGRIMDLLA
ncbi:MAG TPA: flagellin FliC [bacterium]|nr:flagellin FliC [bacterium]